MNYQSHRDIPLGDLKIHPVNKEIYGPLNQREVEDLKESIQEYGLREPLKVVPNNDGTFTILSGHRRYQALTELGREHASVVVPSRPVDEADEIIEVILENQYRTKTNEQRIREGMALEEAEKERARARQAGEQVGEKGAVRDLVAARIGMSGKTYEAGKAAVEKIDSSDDEHAKDIRAKLNKSVSSAAKDEEEDEEEEELDGMPTYWKQLSKAINSLEFTYHKLAKLRSHSTSHEFNAMVGNLMDMANRLRTWDPKLVRQNGAGQYKDSQY